VTTLRATYKEPRTADTAGAWHRRIKLPCSTHLSRLDSLLRDLRHQQAQAAGDLADWLTFLDLEGKRPRTLYAYHREMARLLRAYPDHAVGDYTGDDINTLLRTIPPRSRHISRSIYNQFFVWAALQRRIDVSPMGQVAKVKHPHRIDTGIFTVGEVAQLEALPTPDGQLFALLFGSGLRRFEARNSQRKHVDLDRGRLHIPDGKGGRDDAIPLMPAALQAIADLDLTEGLNPDDHLWGTHPGGGDIVSRRWPIGNTTFSRWYANCIDRAGVRYMKPHTTRHTFHELLKLGGLSLEERQAMMRHESIRTTVDVYGHTDLDVIAVKLAGFSLGNV
jgi:integrase